MLITQDELYMQRCIDLAMLGAGNVAPNPMVGAVLVYNNRIIGEGYHQQYGQAHAEVNCITSVRNEDKHLIEKATLYVSLEPCVHYGKTPPCCDLIIQNKIPKVIIGCRDPFKEVAGRGIEKLKAENIELVQNILQQKCLELNKRFFTFCQKNRPYIILKWAETNNKKIASNNDNRLLISNMFSNKIVHKWRFEEAGILVGTNTALMDNPSLTNRLWTGKNPVRLVIDLHLKLPQDLSIFDNSSPTIVFNLHKLSADNFKELQRQVYYYKLENSKNIVHQIIDACYKLNIQSILVEGGTTLLQSFIDENLFDEVRIITNQDLIIGEGLAAPVIKTTSTNTYQLKNDLINISYN